MKNSTISDKENKGNNNLNNNNNKYKIINDKLNEEEKKFENIIEMKKLLSHENTFNDKFELIEFMSSGSVGTVYEGRIKSSKKKVCLKFLIKEEKTKRDTKEIDIHQILKNKNIISIYDYIPFRYSSSSCIIMEYAKYGDLRNFQRKILKKKYFPEALLCYFAKQILDGLKICHNKKILHLDIKPQNILINNEINAKITDFSSSYKYSNTHGSDQIKLPYAGTSLYMSPEVLKGDIINVNDCDKIDIFSFGVLLYKLAFGEFPYKIRYEDNKDINALYNKINYEPLEFPKNVKVSEIFKNFITKLLKKKIKERININEALKDKWIEGYNIINDEKEKVFFLNEYIKN